MGLRRKFNLVLLVVFLLGLTVTGYVSWDLLQRNAREDVVRNADLMMEAGLAVRAYTVDQVRPQLDLQLMRVFLPQSVPAYAATETMTPVKQKYADYSSKEATLTPTNHRDRAADWEADLVQEFKNQPTVTQLSGERDTPTGRSLSIARPIKVTNPACLACHTTPEMAPATMITRDGPGNGFGWKLNDIVGTQVVSVPIRNAERAFYTFMGSLAAVFLLVFVVLNVMLSRMIVHPIARMAHPADQVSTGNFEIPELAESGQDEIAVLGRAFNRMRRSLQKALQMIED